MQRYLHIYWALVKTSLIGQIAYRTDFWFRLVANLLELATGILLFHFVYHHVESIAGWSVYEAYFLIGTNALINALYNANIGCNMGGVAGVIKQGTLDSILLKPVNPQFWLSVKTFDIRSSFEVIVSLGILAYAVAHLKIHITLVRTLFYLSLVLGGVLLKYALSFTVVTTAFWIVRVDALRAIFVEMFRFSGLPAEIYRGGTKIFFTFVFPMAVIANVPARVFVKGLQPLSVLYLFFLAFTSLLLSNRYWHLGLRRYQSAGG